MNRFYRHLTIAFAAFLAGFALMIGGAIVDRLAVEVPGGLVAGAATLAMLAVGRRYPDYVRNEEGR